MADANWYVVHTYSGYENKVKANIEKQSKIAIWKRKFWKSGFRFRMLWK